MNMANIAELQKWAWSMCLEGFENNKTPYWTADIYSEVPGSNLCRGSDCSQVLCCIRHFLLTIAVLDLDSGHSCFPQHAFHFIIQYDRSLDTVWPCWLLRSPGCVSASGSPKYKARELIATPLLLRSSRMWWNASRIVLYRGADKSLARPDWKNNWKVAIFRPTRKSLLPRRPGWTDNVLIFYFFLCVACKS